MADYSSLQAPNFNALLMQGYQTGREMKRQQGLDNALATYAQNPDDPKSVGEIARYDPRTAIQIGKFQQDRQQQLNEMQQKKLAEGQKAVGNAALIIAQKPEAERPAAWDMAIDELVSMGWDGLAQFRGKYSPQTLEAVIARSGLAGEYQSATRPSYQVIPEGGTLVNTRDPSAVAQFGQPQGAPQQAPAGGEKAPAILNGAKQRGFITAEEIAAVEADLGPNGRDAFNGWMTTNHLPIGKQVGGKTYYQINGKWYDNPEGR